jgi:hypothetical protein
MYEGIGMTVEMKKFGVSLTGREYGKNVATKFFVPIKENPILNFEGVISMGSPFGDEIFKTLMQQGIRQVNVKNYNKAIEDCLKEIQSELAIEIVF